MAEKKLFDKIKQANHLPQLPQVMLKLIRACGREQSSSDDLTRIISMDPSLTAKLLQIIASPYASLPKEVNTIKTAVVYLGVDAIRNIALSSSAIHFFKFSKQWPGFDISRFWYHSIKCGVMARKIAVEAGLSSPEEYFLAGLLHDIGRLVLMKTFPVQYRTILEEAKTDDQIVDGEIKAFQADGSQVSAWLFTQWKLNPLASDAVLFINETFENMEEELLHVKVLYVANILSGDTPMVRLQELSSLLGIHEIRLEQIGIEAEAEVNKMAKALGVDIETDRENENEAENAIALELKDISLFHGTLQSLVGARNLAQVLDVVHRGLEIIFHVPRVFFFLLDEKEKMLTGYSSPLDKAYNIVSTIALPMTNPTSMLIKSVKTGSPQSSFLIQGNGPAAASDNQIIRLLETEGLYCLPITAQGKGLGVMALGVDKATAGHLYRSQRLLGLFSAQTGTCLENIRFHEAYARDVNEKKMDAYATLTDKVIHEINNPISIVRSYLETLSLKLPDKHPAQEELSVVGEEISRVSSLLEGLSRFSKPKVGGFDYVDINRLCTRILEILNKSILLPQKVTSRLQLDPKLPGIKTDQNGVKQILINLIKNASEAMENGGEIDIQTRYLPGSSKVMIDEKKKIPGHIEIRIQDNGPGIGSEIREKLFEPYFTTKNGKNSGLGLSIVHSIVKELKGRISCDSVRGQGTVFSIILPMTPNGSVEKQPAGLQ